MKIFISLSKNSSSAKEDQKFSSFLLKMKIPKIFHFKKLQIKSYPQVLSDDEALTKHWPLFLKQRFDFSQDISSVEKNFYILMLFIEEAKKIKRNIWKNKKVDFQSFWNALLRDRLTEKKYKIKSLLKKKSIFSYFEEPHKEEITILDENFKSLNSIYIRGYQILRPKTQRTSKNVIFDFVYSYLARNENGFAKPKNRKEARDLTTSYQFKSDNGWNSLESNKDFTVRLAFSKENYLVVQYSVQIAGLYNQNIKTIEKEWKNV